MAYEAVISLKQTIHRLLNSSRISIVSSSRQILEFAYSEVNYLQQVLKRSDDRSSDSSKRLNALDGEIRDAVHKLEDLLEFHVSNRQLLSQSESQGDLDLKELRQEIHSFIKSVTKMEEEYIKELDNNPFSEEDEDGEEEEENDTVSSTSIDFDGKMVGLSDELFDMKNTVLTTTRPKEFGVLSIIGLPGTGRTILAERVYVDLCEYGQQQYFDCGAWVTIGPKYQLKEILLSIVAQINNDQLLIWEEEEEKIGEYLYKSLKGSRYMIVLDDVCDTWIWDLLKGSFQSKIMEA